MQTVEGPCGREWLSLARSSGALIVAFACVSCCKAGPALEARVDEDAVLIKRSRPL